jgi:hypothetical protein
MVEECIDLTISLSVLSFLPVIFFPRYAVNSANLGPWGDAITYVNAAAVCCVYVSV